MKRIGRTWLHWSRYGARVSPMVPVMNPEKCWFCFWHPLNIKQRSSAVQSEHLQSTHIQFSLMSPSCQPEVWIQQSLGCFFTTDTTGSQQQQCGSSERWKTKLSLLWVPWFHPLKARSQENSRDLGSIAVLVAHAGMLMHSSGWGGQNPSVESGFKTKQEKHSLWSGFGFISSAPTTAHASTRH